MKTYDSEETAPCIFKLSNGWSPPANIPALM